MEVLFSDRVLCGLGQSMLSPLLQRGRRMKKKTDHLSAVSLPQRSWRRRPTSKTLSHNNNNKHSSFSSNSQ
ncbi:hypothetical protein VIGAN_10249200 [Vigna angularis var. angularis]|uniref:Uncharacterized protein n=1 Tax=Vigna angularis var. angularis TaxID=157739 RepID=A0A0S3T6H2_PHAAN|nr:hypothetical protein VIGAN_10249200 [Vigna angularis var. angularis]